MGKGKGEEYYFCFASKILEMIFLYYYEELTMEEIAELLGLSISTVKTRISRGRERLKLEMERNKIYEQ